MASGKKHDVPLAKIYLLPNLFTAGNLFFGFLCLIRCIQARYSEEAMTSFALYNQAVWCIFGSLVCDGLDGRLARFGGGCDFLRSGAGDDRLFSYSVAGK